MRKIIFTAVACVISLSAAAQCLDKIMTKDGSYYNGFVSEQTPGKQVLVYAEHASMVFKQKDIKNLREDYYDYNRLSKEAKAEIKHMCDTSSLRLSSFEYNGRYYENMYVSNRLDSTVVVLSLTPRTYVIPWTDLLRIKKISVNDQPYGIREIVTLKGGERLVGQIVDQEISKSMVFMTDNGVRRSIPMSDVLSILSEKISDKFTLWEQLPLLDRLIDTNGNKLEGFITTRLVGQHVNILPKYGHVAQQVSTKNILKYQKTSNPDYAVFSPDTAKVLKINHRDVETVSLEERAHLYPVCDTLFQNFFVNAELNLSLKNVSHAKTVAVYKYGKVKVKFSFKNLFKKEKPEKFGIAKNAVPVYETTFMENDEWKKCMVIIREPGKYFLAIDGFKSGVNLQILEELEEKKK